MDLYTSLVVYSSCVEGDVRLAGGETAMEGGWKYVTIRFGGLSVAPPPTGTTEMPLLCVDIYTTQ